MNFTKTQYGQYEAIANNGDKFQVSNEGSRGWMMRTWNAAYGAWIGDTGANFRTLREAKQWITENAQAE